MYIVELKLASRAKGMIFGIKTSQIIAPMEHTRL